VRIASFGEAEQYERSRVKGEDGGVLEGVAVAAFCVVAVVGISAVLGEEVLVGAYRSTGGNPVMPVFL
jgi:hypothetical protein